MSSVTFRGYEKFQKRLAQIQHPPASAKDEMGKTAVQELEKNFSGNPLGWAPLKPETVKRKGHNRILFETGAMMHGYKFVHTAQGIRLENPGAKAAFHQATRPHLVLRQQATQAMLRVYLAEVLK